MTGDFKLCGKIISFDDIRRTYEIDKKKRKLLKLTDAHIAPNSFQKLNVKLTVQVLSHSVAAAINICGNKRTQK